jgi:putative SOS response-associated peptidase YedK
MCGRYRLSRRKQFIEEHFDSVSGEEDCGPRYNIAPTQPVPVIRQNPKEPHSGIVSGPLGTDSVMGEGLVDGCPHD